MSKFGWNKAFDNDEILIANAFFGEKEDVELSKGLLAALYAEILPSIYDEKCEITVEYGALSLSQRGAKEFYHDGSVEPRKSLKLEAIDPTLEQEYKRLDEKPLLFSAWLDACKEAFACVEKTQAAQFDAPKKFLLKDFLGFPLVILEIESWE